MRLRDKDKYELILYTDNGEQWSKFFISQGDIRDYLDDLYSRITPWGLTGYTVRLLPEAAGRYTVRAV